MEPAYFGSASGDGNFDFAQVRNETSEVDLMQNMGQNFNSTVPSINLDQLSKEPIVPASSEDPFHQECDQVPNIFEPQDHNLFNGPPHSTGAAPQESPVQGGMFTIDDIVEDMAKRRKQDLEQLSPIDLGQDAEIQAFSTANTGHTVIQQPATMVSHQTGSETSFSSNSSLDQSYVNTNLPSQARKRRYEEEAVGIQNSNQAGVSFACSQTQARRAAISSTGPTYSHAKSNWGLGYLMPHGSGYPPPWGRALTQSEPASPTFPSNEREPPRKRHSAPTRPQGIPYGHSESCPQRWQMHPASVSTCSSQSILCSSPRQMQTVPGNSQMPFQGNYVGYQGVNNQYDQNKWSSAQQPAPGTRVTFSNNTFSTLSYKPNVMGSGYWSQNNNLFQSPAYLGNFGAQNFLGSATQSVSTQSSSPPSYGAGFPNLSPCSSADLGGLSNYSSQSSENLGGNISEAVSSCHAPGTSKQNGVASVPLAPQQASNREDTWDKMLQPEYMRALQQYHWASDEDKKKLSVLFKEWAFAERAGNEQSKAIAREQFQSFKPKLSFREWMESKQEAPSRDQSCSHGSTGKGHDPSHSESPSSSTSTARSKERGGVNQVESFQQKGGNKPTNNNSPDQNGVFPMLLAGNKVQSNNQANVQSTAQSNVQPSVRLEVQSNIQPGFQCNVESKGPSIDPPIVLENSSSNSPLHSQANVPANNLSIARAHGLLNVPSNIQSSLNSNCQPGFESDNVRSKVSSNDSLNIPPNSSANVSSKVSSSVPSKDPSSGPSNAQSIIQPGVGQEIASSSQQQTPRVREGTNNNHARRRAAVLPVRQQPEAISAVSRCGQSPLYPYINPNKIVKSIDIDFLCSVPTSDVDALAKDINRGLLEHLKPFTSDCQKEDAPAPEQPPQAQNPVKRKRGRPRKNPEMPEAPIRVPTQHLAKQRAESLRRSSDTGLTVEDEAPDANGSLDFLQSRTTTDTVSWNEEGEKLTPDSSSPSPIHHAHSAESRSSDEQINDSENPSTDNSAGNLAGADPMRKNEWHKRIYERPTIIDSYRSPHELEEKLNSELRREAEYLALEDTPIELVIYGKLLRTIYVAKCTEDWHRMQSARTAANDAVKVLREKYLPTKESRLKWQAQQAAEKAAAKADEGNGNPDGALPTDQGFFSEEEVEGKQQTIGKSAPPAREKSPKRKLEENAPASPPKRKRGRPRKVAQNGHGSQEPQHEESLNSEYSSPDLSEDDDVSFEPSMAVPPQRRTSNPLPPTRTLTSQNEARTRMTRNRAQESGQQPPEPRLWLWWKVEE